MIHRKLHSLSCGTHDITFICYGPCKPRPSEIPGLGKTNVRGPGTMYRGFLYLYWLNIRFRVEKWLLLNKVVENKL